MTLPAALLDEIERGLEPFAAEAKEWHREAGAYEGMSVRIGPGEGEDISGWGTAKFTVGDLWRVAEMLSKLRKQEKVG